MLETGFYSDQLYAVTVVFNPHGYTSGYNKYRSFKPYIESSGVKLFTVEIALNDRPFEVTSPTNPWNLQLRSKHILWHKERALNLGFERLMKLVPDAKCVAFMDSDVRMVDPFWARNTVRALDQFAVIQTFSQCIFLGPKNTELWNCPSRFFCFYNKGYSQKPPLELKYVANGHPGLSWAFRVDTVRQLGGLIDWAITGSGDTHMANALMGDVIFNAKPGMSPGFKRALEEWEALTKEFVKENIGYIDGACMHYWHGKPDKRGYDKRWDITCFHQYDPYVDVQIDDNGLYKFTGNKPQLEYDLRLSTASRDEDCNC